MLFLQSHVRRRRQPEPAALSSEEDVPMHDRVPANTQSPVRRVARAEGRPPADTRSPSLRAPASEYSDPVVNLTIDVLSEVAKIPAVLESSFAEAVPARMNEIYDQFIAGNG